MKKYLKLLVFIAALFAAKSASAAPRQAVLPFEIGIASSTAFVQVTTGSGWLFDVHKTSGTAADFTVCFDTGSVSGLGLTLDGTVAAPRIATVFITATNTTTGLPNRAASTGIGFTNGLACANSAAQRSTIFYRQE